MRKQNPDKQQDYTDPDLLQKALYQLLEQISKRDQKISWIIGEKTTAVRSLIAEKAEIEASLLDVQAQLMERESQLHDVLTSRTWKIALFIQRIRIFLVPPESRRAQVLQRGLDIILFPFKKTGRN